MSLLKQAKTLTKRQIALTTALIAQTRYPTRNLVIFMLSVKAGLRAKEIALLIWDMLTDAEGNLGSAIHLRDEASKGRSGRIIPLNKDLKGALQRLHDKRGQSPYVINTERAQRTSPAAIVNLFAHWYRLSGLNGCSSHSGRRTFITNAARSISTVGGSLRDVQMLAGFRQRSGTSRLMLRHKGESWIWSDPKRHSDD